MAQISQKRLYNGSFHILCWAQRNSGRQNDQTLVFGCGCEDGSYDIPEVAKDAQQLILQYSIQSRSAHVADWRRYSAGGYWFSDVRQARTFDIEIGKFHSKSSLKKSVQSGGHVAAGTNDSQDAMSGWYQSASEYRDVQGR